MVRVPDAGSSQERAGNAVFVVKRFISCEIRIARRAFHVKGVFAYFLRELTYFYTLHKNRNKI
jgi:hypothetical protein